MPNIPRSNILSIYSLVSPNMQIPAPSGVVLRHSFQVSHEVKDGGERGADLVRVDRQECEARTVQQSSKILRCGVVALKLIS